jgi:hypothetical protein
MLRNIEACKQLAGITRTSLGPNGMNKLVINHLEKLFVTSDAATIVQELEVAHPAARMLVLAAKMQEQEVRLCLLLSSPASPLPPRTRLSIPCRSLALRLWLAAGGGRLQLCRNVCGRAAGAGREPAAAGRPPFRDY